MVKNIFDKFKTIEELNNIPKGDMPGDKINIDFGHLKKVINILPDLLKTLIPLVDNHPYNRVVISVSGIGNRQI